MPSTMEVGEQLVALCRDGRYLDAVSTLYAEEIVSIEPPCPHISEEDRITRGLEAVAARNAWWLDNHEVHGSEIRGPFPHDERFAVYSQTEITPKVGPKANERIKIAEVALYTVRDGKVAHEEFFYVTD